MHVVEVDDLRAALAHGRAHLAWCVAAADQRARGAHLPRLGGVPEERLVRHTGTPQCGHLQIDCALLAPVDPVAVVDDEDARVGHRSPRAGSTCVSKTSWIASRRYGRSSSVARFE